VAYGERYARVLRGSKLRFEPPADIRELNVVEKLDGGSGTDFGVPGLPASADAAAVDDQELRRLQTILRAGWKAFDAAADSARGKTLQPAGPRGGGREIDKIVSHVLEAEGGYLRMLGIKLEDDRGGDAARVRAAVIEGVAAAAHGETETTGPRGGKRWSPRYFTRRLVWHALDHAWEIEDRLG
jgi:hypothetical protein